MFARSFIRSIRRIPYPIRLAFFIATVIYAFVNYFIPALAFFSLLTAAAVLLSGERAAFESAMYWNLAFRMFSRGWSGFINSVKNNSFGRRGPKG